MRKFYPTFCLLIAAVAVSAGALRAAPANVTYRPALRPKFTAGQAFGYSAAVQYESRMSVTEYRKQPQPDGPPKLVQNNVEKVEENYAINFQTDGALARAVFPNGALREALFLVNRCVLTNNNDGKLETLLPPGAILGMRVLNDGQIAFAVNGEAPNQQLADRLSMLLAQLGDSRYTYDEMLGPPEAVSAGSRWPVNGDAIMRSVLVQMFPGTNQVAGSMTLDETKLKDGQPQAVTSGAYILGGSRPPFPTQVRARPSLVGFRLQITSPLAGGPGDYNYRMNASVTHQGTNGDVRSGMSEARIEFTINMDRDATFSVDPNRRPLAALTSAPAIPTNIGAATKPGVTTAQLIPPIPMPRSATVSAPNDGPPPPLVDLPPATPAASPFAATPAAPAPAQPVATNTPAAAPAPSTARSKIAPPPSAGIFNGAKPLSGNSGALAPLANPLVSPSASPPAAQPAPASPFEPLSPFNNAKPLPQQNQ